MTLKASELRDLDADELAGKLAEAKEELFNLRFQNVTGQLDNPNRLGEVKRDIARIFTIMAERERDGETVTAAPVARPAARRRGLRKGRS